MNEKYEEKVREKLRRIPLSERSWRLEIIKNTEPPPDVFEEMLENGMTLEDARRIAREELEP